MKRLLLTSCLLLLSLPAIFGQSVLQSAWKSLAGLDGFTVEKAEGALFGLPESMGEGDLAVHPNSSQRGSFTALLDAISDDFLLGQLSDDSFDERLFLEPSGESGFNVLYTLVGSGGADTIAYFDTIDTTTADQLAEMWEQHINEAASETEEELEQDFSDE